MEINKTNNVFLDFFLSKRMMGECEGQMFAIRKRDKKSIYTYIIEYIASIRCEQNWINSTDSIWVQWFDSECDIRWLTTRAREFIPID